MADDKKISEFEISTTLNEAYFAGYMTGDTVNNWQFSVSLFDARYYTQSSGLPANAITGGTFNDARVAQSNVTQHNAALSHSLLTSASLSADDHSQYHNDSRALTWLGSQGAAIKTAYEAEADTNAFTDAEKTKLSGIAAGATVGATWGVNITSQPTLSTVATSGAYSDLSGKPTLGTAAALNVGTGANQVVQLDGSGHLPAVDGSALTNLPAGSALTSTQVKDSADSTVGSVSGLLLNTFATDRGSTVLGTKKSSSEEAYTLRGNGSGDYTSLIQNAFDALESTSGAAGGTIRMFGDFNISSTGLTPPDVKRFRLVAGNDSHRPTITYARTANTYVACRMIDGDYGSSTLSPEVEIRGIIFDGAFRPLTGTSRSVPGDYLSAELKTARIMNFDSVYRLLVEGCDISYSSQMGCTSSGGIVKYLYNTVRYNCRDALRTDANYVEIAYNDIMYCGDDGIANHWDKRSSSPTGTLSNKVYTTSGTDLIKIAHTGHNLIVNQAIWLQASAVVNDVEINGVYIVDAVDANNYWFRCGTAATGTTSGGGGTLSYAYAKAPHEGPRYAWVHHNRLYGTLALKCLGANIQNIHDNLLEATRRYGIVSGVTAASFAEGCYPADVTIVNNTVRYLLAYDNNLSASVAQAIYNLSGERSQNKVLIRDNAIIGLPPHPIDLGTTKYSDLNIHPILEATTEPEAHGAFYKLVVTPTGAEVGSDADQGGGVGYYCGFNDIVFNSTDGNPFATYGVVVENPTGDSTDRMVIANNRADVLKDAFSVKASFIYDPFIDNMGARKITLPSGSSTGSITPSSQRVAMSTPNSTYIDFAKNPDASSVLTLATDVSGTWTTKTVTTGTEFTRGSDLAASLANLLAYLQGSADTVISQATYYVKGTRLYILAKTAGTAKTFRTDIGSTLNATAAGGECFLFNANPADGSWMWVNGVKFTFKDTPGAAPDVQRHASAKSTTLDNLLTVLASYSHANLTGYSFSRGYTSGFDAIVGRRNFWWLLPATFRKSVAPNATYGGVTTNVLWGGTDYTRDFKLDLTHADTIFISVKNGLTTAPNANCRLYLAYSIDGGTTFVSLKAGDFDQQSSSPYQNSFTTWQWELKATRSTSNGWGTTTFLPPEAKTSSTIIRVLGQSGGGSAIDLQVMDITAQIIYSKATGKGGVVVVDNQA